jgi:hypothetical protein
MNVIELKMNSISKGIKLDVERTDMSIKQFEKTGDHLIRRIWCTKRC